MINAFTKHGIFTIIVLLSGYFGNAQQGYVRSYGSYFMGDASGPVGAHIDSESNIVITGSVASIEEAGFYTQFSTAGAFQESIAGNVDSFIMKLNQNGDVIWSTYFGGPENDFPMCSATDAQNNIYIAGSSNSLTGIATAGALYESPPTEYSGFLAKFSSAGELMWSTYFPGVINDIKVAQDGTLYTCGMTLSPDGIATPGSFYTTFMHTELQEQPNGFISRFSPAGEQISGTYYGKYNSPSIDQNKLTSLAIGNDGQILICGRAAQFDNLFSYTTPGCHQSSLFGNYDAYLASLSPDLTQRNWGTFYGGEGIEPLAYLKSVEDGFCVFGSTNSSTNMTTSGASQEIIAGNFDGFISKFDNSGQRQWGTYLGGSMYDGVLDIEENDDHLYISGYTRSTSGISYSDALQPQNNGLFDAFTGSFSTAGQKVWVSYFGGEDNDYGDFIRIKGNGIFLFGHTYSATGISTPNGLYPLPNVGPAATSNDVNVFMTRFDPELSIHEYTGRDFRLSPNPGAGRFTVQGKFTGGVTLRVYDVAGRPVASHHVVISGSGSEIPFDFEGKVSAGAYLARLTSDSGDDHVFKLLIN